MGAGTKELVILLSGRSFKKYYGAPLMWMFTLFL